jgi:hypothetical protein
MRFRLLFGAIVLITLPALYLMDYLGLMNFEWKYFVIFWPMLLIFWGIAILPFKEFVRVLILVIMLMGTGFFVYAQLLRNPKYFEKTYTDMLNNEFVKKIKENMPKKADYIDSEENTPEEDSMAQHSNDSIPDSLSGPEAF